MISNKHIKLTETRSEIVAIKDLKKRTKDQRKIKRYDEIIARKKTEVKKLEAECLKSYSESET